MWGHQQQGRGEDDPRDGGAALPLPKGTSRVHRARAVKQAPGTSASTERLEPQGQGLCRASGTGRRGCSNGTDHTLTHTHVCTHTHTQYTHTHTPHTSCRSHTHTHTPTHTHTHTRRPHPHHHAHAEFLPGPGEAPVILSGTIHHTGRRGLLFLEGLWPVVREEKRKKQGSSPAPTWQSPREGRPPHSEGAPQTHVPNKETPAESPRRPHTPPGKPTPRARGHEETEKHGEENRFEVVATCQSRATAGAKGRAGAGRAGGTQALTAVTPTGSAQNSCLFMSPALRDSPAAVWGGVLGQGLGDTSQEWGLWDSVIRAGGWRERALSGTGRGATAL